MTVLGIGTGLKLGHHDPSASIIEGARVVAAVEEERLNRQKHAKSEFPLLGIEFCLRTSGKKFDEVEFAFPLASYPKLDDRISDLLQHHFGSRPIVHLYDHHHCHAASSYLLSGYSNALSISLDNSGDSCSGMISVWDGNKVDVLKRIDRQDSLGIFYGMLTQFLGFRFNTDEYKVMGLSSFEEPDAGLIDHFEKIIRFDGAGGVEVNQDFDRRNENGRLYTTDFSTRYEPLYSTKWLEFFGPPRFRGEELSILHKKIAASAQHVFENVLVDLVAFWTKKTNQRRLCLSGGCFQNVKAVSEIRKRSNVSEIFIPPAAGDNGLSMGAALLRTTELGHRPPRLTSASLGPSFSNNTIENDLSNWGASFERVESSSEFTADALARGEVVAWFQGGLEFGPRALGNRSILANPNVPSIKEKINSIIKKRERFRPFAPSILERRARELFPEIVASPFMTEIFSASSEARNVLPAAVHIDGTARVQTVSADAPKFFDLISKFFGLTGIPAVLNTSFNIAGEPIICSPFDAVRSFYSSPLDRLVIGDFVVRK
ncbi:carbamoyltransferase family protein [Roseovarius indicus]|uniref:carbamoyltransferase family protein n=1 Tax=Roseovarius indicus TaxID=540747 RepID=UPI003512DFEF